ncbi:uncharacterized protein LOC129779937 [Toxorhynchites rutilus septentrionalis]|uniref:uncharacterized protein LOC129779937 n=1 Tax=Toxorhynchites rutilus septentrionalis TaxID=329112 RepID=UPI00247A84ED|nr:uncharacterized protein LOC129779937 [Toxorhynchites rutilus septentrionalis]XP_055643700.1 uncharacterized protein LOC129779937 [Toxorhynchites rutilus septentrionalis]XP_055643701.1 uncharacterized protein LOC129779937 [Toxorhynchites rutilus septentrionalis]XP_055643702.1 uncharacterized protein LOC129779937 [Toxorhynchites rutilus septentrionalis]
MAPLPEDEITLHLEYWADELSPAQKAAYEKAEKEHNDIRNKLKDIVKDAGGKNIFSGEVFTAYQVLGPVPGLEQISKPITSLPKKKPPPSPGSSLPATPSLSMKRVASPTGLDSGKRKSRRSEYKPEEEAGPSADFVADDDDEEYIPLSKRLEMKKKEKAAREAAAKETKKREEKKMLEKKVETKPLKKQDKPQSITASNVRPTEATSIGGLLVGGDKEKKKITAEPTAIVDLTKDDSGKPAADSREISFSKIQGKTFPSLVVIARPSLRSSEKAPADRPQLDAKVKNVLMHTATKFTEWLIQQGLVKSEQFCQIHRGTALKLGMYSDASKFPYSGGYVWISECCPTRFISVFNGSLFEGSMHPPSVILKLIYHWSCQTNVSNVVNWVKVDNLYVKGLYTWLRSVCTVALSHHMKLLGGIGKKIEVGVISLGTTTQDGQQRQVKVEVLGVLDPEAKLVRLRAVEPLSDGERNYKKRFSKILEPLSGWVHKDSVILTDLTVDKGTLNNMGYKIVQQVSPSEASGKHSNANIMDYLRRIVPRMFQNTLSLLSRQIIQQFLNELVWRESFGNSPGQAFDNIVTHIAEQTRIETRDALVTRMNKAAADPFKHWTYAVEPHTTPKPSGAKRGRKPKEPSPPPLTSGAPKKILLNKLKREEAVAIAAAEAKSQPLAKKSRTVVEEKEELLPLELYYYGQYDTSEVKEGAEPAAFSVTCPECPTTFRNNCDFQEHLFRHAYPIPDGQYQCRYCLENWATEEVLKKHTVLIHSLETKNSIASTYNCLICEQRFGTIQMLTTHLQKIHLQLELPYKCAGCDFKSSSHHLTIDHFYKKHNRSGLIQCPFCLKMALVCNTDGPIAENVSDFMKHLKMHFNKTIVKKCGKCALSFVSRGALKMHTLFAHVMTSPGPTVKPITRSLTIISKPKAKRPTQRELTQFKTLESYGHVTLNMACGKVCLECDNDFDEDDHMIGLSKCLKCSYQTACLPSMVGHTAACNTNPTSDYPVFPLDMEMHCICGFSSSDGNALARHLVTCDRKSVYPTVEACQENTVKRNMLDMLGLVRREDEAVVETEESFEQTPTAIEEEVTGSENVSSDQPLAAAYSGSNASVAYDPSQSLYNIAGTGNEQFNTQLSLDDLGPPSVLAQQQQDNDRTPQLKDDYQSLATPRVSNMETDQGEFDNQEGGF